MRSLAIVLGSIQLNEKTPSLKNLQSKQNKKNKGQEKKQDRKINHVF